jgi:hypothetical protein
MSTRRLPKPKTRQNSPAKKTASGQYVRRDHAGRFVSGRRVSGHYELVAPPARRTVDMSDYHPLAEPPRRATEDVIIREDGVTISGSPAAIEDYLDAWEIDRRLADSSNQRRISLAELRAKRGL